jgi:hypothetical protein
MTKKPKDKSAKPKDKSTPNPFDPAALRLDQSFADTSASRSY